MEQLHAAAIGCPPMLLLLLLLLAGCRRSCCHSDAQLQRASSAASLHQVLLYTQGLLNDVPLLPLLLLLLLLPGSPRQPTPWVQCVRGQLQGLAGVA